MWEGRRGEKSEQFEMATYELHEYSGDYVRIGLHRDVGQPFEKANICTSLVRWYLVFVGISNSPTATQPLLSLHNSDNNDNHLFSFYDSALSFGAFGHVVR